MTRSRVIMPLIAALLLLAGCDWTQAGFDAANSGNNNSETTLTLANVSALHTAWVAPGASGNGSNGLPAWSTGPLQQLAVSGGRAFSLDDLGSLAAVKASTGTGLWADPAYTVSAPSTLCFPGPGSRIEGTTGLTVIGNLVYGHHEAIVCLPFSNTVSDITSTVNVADGTIGASASPTYAGPFVPGPDGTIYQVNGGASVTGGGGQLLG